MSGALEEPLDEGEVGGADELRVRLGDGVEGAVVEPQRPVLVSTRFVAPGGERALEVAGGELGTARAPLLAGEVGDGVGVLAACALGRLGEEAGDEGVVAGGGLDGEGAPRADVMLGRSAGARAGASVSAREDDVEQSCGGEPVEVVGGELAGDPGRSRRVVASDGVDLGDDEVVEAAPARVAEESERLDVSQWIPLLVGGHSLKLT